MTTFLKRRLPVIVVIAVLLTGGAVAAMAAGGTGSPRPHGHRAHQLGAAPLRGARVREAAASYIGIPLETLEQELRSGKSLGEIATEAGKTEAGLVAALASAAKAGLEQRLALAVKQPGGLSAQHRTGHRLRVAAARYLGLTPLELSAKLRSGLTLGEVADATPGHSREGLIDYLVAARTRAANPLVTKPKRDSGANAGRVRQRITELVDRPHAAAGRTTKEPKSPLGG